MALSTIPTAGLSSDQGVNFRNLIINGDMSIAQRGTSFSFNNSSGFTVDRFAFEQTTGATGDCTITQESDAPSNTGLVKSVKIAVDTAETPTGSGNICFQQKLEGFNCAPLEHGQSSPPSATLSFWVKSNKTGTYSVQIKGEGSTGRYLLFDYTISSANTWEKKTITWIGDTSVALDYDNARRLRVVWHLASGPNDKVSPTSSWATNSLFQVSTNQVNFFDSASNEWYITGVQLEVGTTASDFEFLPYDVNLKRCMRYFFNHYTPNDNGLYGLFTAHTTSAGRLPYRFIVPMRDAPSTSFSTAAGFTWLGNNTSGNPTTMASESLNKYSCTINVGGSFSQGYSYWLAGSTSTEAKFDAEL